MGNTNAIVEMLRDENENLKKRIKDLEEIVGYVEQTDDKGLKRMQLSVANFKMLEAMWRESIKEAQEAKEGYEELRKELLLAHELKQVGKE